VRAADRPCGAEGCQKRRYSSPGGWVSPLCIEHRQASRRPDPAPHPWDDVPVHSCFLSDGMPAAVGNFKRNGWWKDQRPGSRFAGHPPECPYQDRRPASSGQS
jgi:hypothetical protein